MKSFEALGSRELQVSQRWKSSTIQQTHSDRESMATILSTKSELRWLLRFRLQTMLTFTYRANSDLINLTSYV
ncbi:hypothetical protein Cha6605_1294 [Chamaesiphon minutus PCC 6605]|uniref:Uncharacterized protein n=1 Tax=Chamaesiphon minutus (strain ATCC 27169 / PCC 6605) TaxID=1173020 RepID=K9UCC6_CHAP6|nr:hypothetical protein Cha6605_1294 [Chamaesiphon minutus PCC 6605]